MSMLISYCHNMILSAVCLIDDCDSEGMLWPMNMRLFISYCYDVILSTGCSIDDRDSGSVMANDYEIVYQ